MINQAETETRFLTRKELAKRYSVSVKNITKWQKDGFIPVMRVNSRMFRYPIPACDDAVKALIINPKG